MSLQRSIPAIPPETVLVAKAVFPKGNVYMQMRDELGNIYDDELFASVYAEVGQPAIAPWRLALVSIMQFAENLSDRQAAEAVRARIDWKYALSLPLQESGFHSSVLSELRDRLLQGRLESKLLDTLLELWKPRGSLRARGRQRTDSTHVLGAVKVLNSLELVGETVRHALNVLATVVPEWLKQQVKPEWFDRYGQRMQEYRLPKDKSERAALSTTMGEDGFFLLACIQHAKDMPWRREASGDPNVVRGLGATLSSRAGTGLSLDPTGDASRWRVDSLSLRPRGSLWQKAIIRVDGIQSACV